MDDLHELREMITICADELQEAAQENQKMTDALIMLNESMGEFIVVTALSNGKLAACTFIRTHHYIIQMVM